MESEDIIAWTRMSVLILALGIAAWLDHKERRVPNEFWITWSKPAIFLWTLDLLNQEANPPQTNRAIAGGNAMIVESMVSEYITGILDHEGMRIEAHINPLQSAPPWINLALHAKSTNAIGMKTATVDHHNCA